jgi:hypothetical protein
MEAEIDRLRGQLRQREQEYEEVMRAMLNQDVTSSFNAPTSSASSSSVSLGESVGVSGVGTMGVTGVGTTGVNEIGTTGVTGVGTSGVNGVGTTGINEIGTNGVTGVGTMGITGVGTTGVTGVGTMGVAEVGSTGVDAVGVRGGRTEVVVIPADSEISATSSRNSSGDLFLNDINSTYDSYISAVERNPPTSSPTDVTMISRGLPLHAEPSPLSLPSTAFTSPRIDALLNNLSPLDGSLSGDEEEGKGSEGEGSAVRTLVTARGSGSESDTVVTNSSINTINIAIDNAYVDTSSCETHFHDDYHHISHSCVFLLMPI